MTEEDVRPSFKRAKSEPKETVIEAIQTSTEPSSIQSDLPSRLQEVASLIEVKHYVRGLIDGNFTIDKAKMKELQGISLLLDMKIVDLILSEDFKTFVGYKDVDKAIKTAATNNNIKSSFYR